MQKVTIDKSEYQNLLRIKQEFDKIKNDKEFLKRIQCLYNFLEVNKSEEKTINEKSIILATKKGDYTELFGIWADDDKLKYTNLPIEWSNEEPNGNDFFEIWKDNPKTIEQIREKAWKKS